MRKRWQSNKEHRSFLAWGELVEKWLIRVVAISLVALVAVQALMTQDPFRFYLSFAERLQTERLEETPWVQPALAPDKDAGSITLELTNYSSLEKALVIVNGQVAGDFREKRITIPVQAGDTVEVDGSYYQYPLSILVLQVSDNIASPKEKQVVKVEGSRGRVGQITVMK